MNATVQVKRNYPVNRPASLLLSWISEKRFNINNDGKVQQIVADLRFITKVLLTYVVCVCAYYIVFRLGMNDVAASQFVYFVSSEISCGY